MSIIMRNSLPGWKDIRIEGEIEGGRQDIQDLPEKQLHCDGSENLVRMEFQ